MKKQVQMRMERKAIQRYTMDVARKANFFMQTIAGPRKMLQRDRIRNDRKYHELQNHLQDLFKWEDGKMLDVLPVWIMPTDLVSELLPADLGLFDLIILEEASQSDCQAIPALLRGKKLVLVGDEKQVNPRKRTEAFKDQIKASLGDKLPEDTRANLLPGASVFDLFRAAFQGMETVLREHFRCLPEIIGFCNEQFYSDSLIPLRASKPGYGQAIQVCHVKDVTLHSKKFTNEQEAIQIVDRVRCLLKEDEQSGRTPARSIGIISLWKEEQANLIESRLKEDAYISEFWEKHQIQCGDARSFQGDQKDIVLLSMVRGMERRNPSDDEAGFNVAV